MLSLIFRVFIVFTVFIAGAFVGNIYMPQKTLEQSYIVSLDEPETSFDTNDTPSLQNALNALTQMSAALEQTDMDKETIFRLEDAIKKQLYAKTFKAAKAEYEIELLKVQKHPQNHDSFLKAKDIYYSVSDMIEQAYPPLPQLEIPIVDSPATNQLNIQISTAAAQGLISSATASGASAEGLPQPEYKNETKQ